MAQDGKQLSAKYQKKTDKEHILDNPDTYIGSIENVEHTMYVYQGNEAGHSFIEKNMMYNPGLFKLFDEGIVNCRDHYIRMKQQPTGEQVTQIQVEIKDDQITLINNGNGIDVEKHPEYDIWIPEMIFGHLRTSTNYNKAEKKITGGKNGFGFKLVLIWSTYGKIETIDHVRGLKYIQEFEKNLDIIHKPKITKSKSKPYTSVTFKPDYQRLGMQGLTADMLSLFQRRVYDIAGITPKDVKVKMNQQSLKVNDFKHYVQLYLNEEEKKQTLYEVGGERWSIAVSLHSEYKQVSFVNGICTSKGGKHVDYVVNQITKKMIQYILQKKKVTVKPAVIKEQLFVFVNCVIENPSFDSQTKDYLNTSVTKFGSSYEVSSGLIDKLAKMGIMNTSCALSEIKDKKNAKKTDGNKNKNIRGIPKLVDANFAGTPKSSQTMLILCEGDSAKAGILSGLSNEDRNVIGVYPMRGKLFNVRGETQKRINESKEINEIKKIMGLESSKVYENVNDLRYGKIIFMTDQDLDGSHIKGLCINFIAYLWPSLLNISGFIGFMNTPILKASKSNKTLQFYTQGDYDAWKEANENGKGYKIKYYKGLGTSTSKEFKEYFKEKRVVSFVEAQGDGTLIDKVFNKTKADERKQWLVQYDRKRYLDVANKSISYHDFIDNELIHFSKYDCDRSIPNVMDGLKISQRKILFSAFKKNLHQEIKVAQFSGYVSEQSGYHHGEASLNGAIVNMAQDYVGSNNLHLLMPNGQFGTRLQGGKDSASERYIYTKLNALTRKIFRKEDDGVLEYLDDDGLSVEPIYYVPIIPMVLVNGALGIGTGFATNIPCYDPKQIIHCIKQKIKDGTMEYEEPNMVPYYRGFKGTIAKIEDHRYATTGCYHVQGKSTLVITELPIGTWNENYVNFLEKCLDDKKWKMKDYRDLSTDKDIVMEIQFVSGVTLSDQKTLDKIVKQLKLTTTLSTSNMYLFNKNETLTKYENANAILNDFIETRLEYYETRKQNQIIHLEGLLMLYSNKYRFITELLENVMDLRKKKACAIEAMLIERKYDHLEEKGGYNYLIKMPMDMVNEENVEKLKTDFDHTKEALEALKQKSIVDMYYDELCELEEAI
jgi:DNA topoisomerase II